MNPYALLALVGIWLASILGAAYFGHDYAQKQYLATENQRLIAWNEALDRAAERVGKQTVTNRTIYNQAETVVKEKYVLTECKNPVEMIDAINRAAKGGVK